MPDATAERTESRLTLPAGSPLRLCAAASAADAGAITALLDGVVVGRVSYERVYGPRAQLSLDVDDAHWHCGLADTLLVAVSLLAARRGIARFLMRVGAADLQLLTLLREDFAAIERREDGEVAVEFTTSPPAGAHERMHDHEKEVRA